MQTIEVDLDVDVVRKIRAGYEADVAPNLGYSTDDICYVDPYHPDKEVWDDEGVYKSNAKWYSLRSEKTYQKHLRYVEAFGLKDIFKQTWINSDEVTVYGMFFLVRSHSMVHHIHWDWQAEINTQLITFLIPIKDIDIHLAYLDNEENMQKYEYKVGKGIGFAGGFMHGTDVGHTDTDDVLFSVYLGGDDPDIFDFWQASSADELENHMHPTKGWIRNQWYGRTQIYLPKRAKQVESNSTRGRLCLQ